MDVEKMSIEELVDFVNKRYREKKDTNLITLSEELNITKNKLYSLLKNGNYVFKNKQYIKSDVKAQEIKIKQLDMAYLITKDFNYAISARVNEETYKEFTKMCSEKFTSVNTGKLISIALKEFIEKYN